MNWPPIPVDAPMRDLIGKHVAVSGSSIVGKPTLVLVTIRKASRGRVRFLCMDTAVRTEPPPVPVSGQVPGTATLADVMQAYGPIQAQAAGEVPRILWHGNSRPNEPRQMIYLIAAIAALVIILAILLNAPSLILTILQRLHLQRTCSNNFLWKAYIW